MDMQKSLNRRDFMKVAGATGLAGMAFAGGIASPAFASTQMADTTYYDFTDLFFYSQSLGRGEFYGTDGKGHMHHLSTYSALSRNFAQILSGEFIEASATEGLLFYDNVQGSGTFYRPDRKGGVDLLSHHTGWRKTWTHIVSGNLTRHTVFEDLVFYDANSGVSEIYSTDGVGRIQLIKHDIWRRHWTTIVSGSNTLYPYGFTNVLFFYDRANGIGEFYRVNDSGSLSLLHRHTGLRTTWTTIIRVPLGLLFYDANSGVSEFYRPDAHGGLHLLKHDIWSKGWTHISGNVAGSLLFYNSNTGTCAFYKYADNNGNISLLHRDTWRKGWTRIIDNEPVLG